MPTYAIQLLVKIMHCYKALCLSWRTLINADLRLISKWHQMTSGAACITNDRQGMYDSLTQNNLKRGQPYR